MGSRILQASQQIQKNRIAICCVFMITAAAASYGCPFAEAAGMSSESHYSATGSILVNSDNQWAQSTGEIGAVTAGQQTLTGGTGTRMLANSGTSEFLSQSMIDSNDHQVYVGVTQGRMEGGGMILDTGYLSTEITAADPAYEWDRNAGTELYGGNDTMPEVPDTNTSINSTGNATLAPPNIPFPISETVTVEKGIFGGSGEYRAEKQIEQGSNETTDFLTVNARARGSGSFINKVDAKAEVSFSPYSNSPNFVVESHQNDIVVGHEVTSMFTWESFGDVFMNPSNQTNATEEQ